MIEHIERVWTPPMQKKRAPKPPKSVNLHLLPIETVPRPAIKPENQLAFVVEVSRSALVKMFPRLPDAWLVVYNSGLRREYTVTCVINGLLAH